MFDMLSKRTLDANQLRLVLRSKAESMTCKPCPPDISSGENSSEDLSLQ
jgi:hypothetical protein